MKTRPKWIAALISLICFVVFLCGLSTTAFAQPRYFVERNLLTILEGEPSDHNASPLTLVSASNAAMPKNPNSDWPLQGPQGNSVSYHYQLFDTTQPSLDQQAAAQGNNSGSGAGLAGLPSFRGIKGIRNLPGGVGTLLMANPHVGTDWYPEQSTNQPGTSLSMERFDFQGAVPIYNKGKDTFVFTANYDDIKVYTNAILPTTNQKFPAQLFNIALGINYFHAFENGNVGGFVVDVGSASDQPFQNGRDVLASGTGFLLIPSTDEGSWFVGVNASTNSQVLYGIPIPGGGYFYHPNEEFQAIVGFPFSVVSWKPAKDWQLQYVYAFLTTMHARAIYQPSKDWQLFAGFDWTNENWHRAQRENIDDHFFYYEKKLTTGLLYWFAPHVGLEASGGWAFDRYFTEVDGFSLQGTNTVNVGSGPYLSVQMNLRF